MSRDLNTRRGVRARHVAGIRVCVCMAVAAGLMVAGPAARGEIFNIADSDEAGLIQAINDSNANSEADEINLAPGSIYTLTVVDNMTDGPNGLPSITTDITVNGNGSIIRRTAASLPLMRIFHVAVGGILTLNDLQLRNGWLPDGNFGVEIGGGAILNLGTTTINDSAILQNRGGIGISNGNGGTGGDGGGIYNVGTMTVNRSTITENVAGDGGFGLDFGGSGGSGGGIRNEGVFLLSHSTVSDNSAGEGGGSSMFPGSDGDGGGIYNVSGGDMEIVASTITQNTAGNSGGGIRNYFAQLVIRSSTITRNSALQFGGGGVQNNADVDISHTIFANQTVGPDCDGVMPFSLDHNLDSDGTCMLSEPGDISGGNAMLGPLQDNGGPTETHLPMAGSDAIDAGNEDASATDQRGYARPADGDGDSTAVSDIGAVEVVDCNGDMMDDGDPTDSDGDGVPDLCDVCPGEDDTLDTDSDGVVDCLDSCPLDAGDDSDGDGVCDSDDVCPNGDDTTDADGDGTPDACDDCPNDPAKFSAGACGCGTPDSDSDSDGTPDCLDLCPNDPAKTDPGACGCGTPDTDANGNGVPDCMDVPTTQPTVTDCLSGLLSMIPVMLLGCMAMRRRDRRLND